MNRNSFKQAEAEGMRRMREEERKSEDLRKMTTPGSWPRLGWLPIKKRAGHGHPHDPDYCALLNCWDEVKPIVYLANLFSVGEEYGKPTADGKGHWIDLSKVPQKSYPDFKALVEEWTVD